jgi:hypothetical protein
MKEDRGLPRNLAAVLGLLGALTGLAAPAVADDGVYLGTLTFGATQMSGLTTVGRGCPGAGDVKLTVTGTKIDYDGLSGGRRASGVIQDDGKFTATGSYGAGLTAANIVVTGDVDHLMVRADYTAQGRDATCAGSISARRQ